MSRVIFLDCGTHKGQGLEELIPKFPQGTEIHCFEPNPLIELSVESLVEIAEKGGQMAANVTLHREAIYDYDGTTQFASIGAWPRFGVTEYNGRGQSSSITGYRDTTGGLFAKNEVPCVSLLTFLRSLQLEEGDEVHIKLDVEGAEFKVLKHLLANGADVLPFIKRMWVEWHGRYFVAEGWERNKGHRDLTDALNARGVLVHVWR